MPSSYVRPVVVERELEFLVLVRDSEEVVCRPLRVGADDVHGAAKLEPERLVERTALLRIRDPLHGVQVTGHALHRKPVDSAVPERLSDPTEREGDPDEAADCGNERRPGEEEPRDPVQRALAPPQPNEEGSDVVPGPP